MTDTEPDSGAEVPRLPTRSGPVPQPPDVPVAAVTYDTSFEVVLDDEPTSAVPVPVDVGHDDQGDRRPIVPGHLRGRGALRVAAKRAAGRAAYRGTYHVVRAPRYLGLSLWWGLVGLLRGIGAQLRWWWMTEAAPLRREAVEKKDYAGWEKHHREAKRTRYTRGRWLLLELAAVSGGVAAVFTVAPRWWWAVVTLVGLLPLLAHYGRPADRPIVSAAVVSPRFRVINSDVVLRAYYSAGLGSPDKPDQKVEFGSTMSRDNLQVGSQVVVRLPYGRTFSDALAAREKIASGLDVALSQVYLTKDRDSNRSHLLFVTDVDPLSIPAGRTPLLDCKPRDIWRPVPLGLDERGRRVMLAMVFQSLLIGAQPRRGKTFTARLIALFAALDPYVRLSVFDGAGKPDLRMFALVAHTYGFGLLPDRVQGNPVENLLATLRAAKKEILQRNVRLSELPTSVCPEGKLTRDIARNPHYRMPVWVILLDEFQEFLKTGDETVDTEVADLLVFAVRVGPSTGVILISSTQRPAGLGSSTKVGKLFADYRDNHLMRFALKTGSTKVSDYILGEGVHSEGFDSSDLPVGEEYRGIGILYNAPVDNCVVRTYLADGRDAEKILTAARRHRERLGTLDGMAAGQSIAVQARDPLADTLDAFRPDEAWASWRELAERLADQRPEQYAKVTGDALSATLRDLKLGIESSNGRVPASEAVPSGVTKGPKRAALERALERRAREEASS